MTPQRYLHLFLLGLLAIAGGMCLALVVQALSLQRQVSMPPPALQRDAAPNLTPSPGEPPGVHRTLDRSRADEAEAGDAVGGSELLSFVFSFCAAGSPMAGLPRSASGLTTWLQIERRRAGVEPGEILFSGSTDPAGRIGLTLPAGVYHVAAVPYDPRFQDIDSTLQLSSSANGTEFRWSLTCWPGLIDGRVVDARTGRGLADVAVHLDPGARTHREARTGTDGSFRIANIADGQHRLHVELGSLADTFLPPPDIYASLNSVRSGPARVGSPPERTLSLDGAVPERTVRFELEPAARITGHVRTQAGSPAAGVRLQANSTDSGFASIAEVGAGGAFVVRGLRAGSYRVVPLHPWSARELADARVVDLRSSGEPLEIDFTVPEPKGALEGTVRREVALESRNGSRPADDGGVAGALVKLQRSSQAAPDELASDPQGRFRFEALWPGLYPVSVEPPAGRELVCDLDEPCLANIPEEGSGSLTLPLVPSASLVVVPFDSHHPEAAGSYTLEIVGSEPFYLERRFARSERRLQIDGLPPGRFEVSLLTLDSEANIESQSVWVVRLEAGGVQRLTEGWGDLP
ncbi:MAG: hypothetical protein AB1486_15900 [Planctomycetota bacterium]